MPDFSLPKQDFASKIDDWLEKAINEKRWKDAKAYQELRDWFFYDKDISWLPILETL